MFSSTFSCLWLEKKNVLRICVYDDRFSFYICPEYTGLLTRNEVLGRCLCSCPACNDGKQLLCLSRIVFMLMEYRDNPGTEEGNKKTV